MNEKQSTDSQCTIERVYLYKMENYVHTQNNLRSINSTGINSGNDGVGINGTAAQRTFTAEIE